MTVTLKELLADIPRPGKVEWIGLRPSAGQEMLEPASVRALSAGGLEGDRYAGRSGKRHVTLIQWEHLAVIAAYLGIDSVTPSRLRRNIGVSGLNLLALKDRAFRIGDAVFEFTGQCHPCSAMYREFGGGGYNAVRGHGGITARVVTDGTISLGDFVVPLQYPVE